MVLHTIFMQINRFERQPVCQTVMNVRISGITYSLSLSNVRNAKSGQSHFAFQSKARQRCAVSWCNHNNLGRGTRLHVQLDLTNRHFPAYYFPSHLHSRLGRFRGYCDERNMSAIICCAVTAGRGAVWQRACFGSKMPGVRVTSLRPQKNADFDTIGVLFLHTTQLKKPR